MTPKLFNELREHHTNRILFDASQTDKRRLSPQMDRDGTGHDAKDPNGGLKTDPLYFF
jgi:hypothetical protein